MNWESQKSWHWQADKSCPQEDHYNNLLCIYAFHFVIFEDVDPSSTSFMGASQESAFSIFWMASPFIPVHLL